VRIAARLVRADTGFIVWSESDDCPFDDIASRVTKALRASIERP